MSLPKLCLPKRTKAYYMPLTSNMTDTWLSHVVMKLPSGELVVQAYGTAFSRTREETTAKLQQDYPGCVEMSDAELDTLMHAPSRQTKGDR
jgi:hypothetical protein